MENCGVFQFGELKKIAKGTGSLSSFGMTRNPSPWQTTGRSVRRRRPADWGRFSVSPETENRPLSDKFLSAKKPSPGGTRRAGKAEGAPKGRMRRYPSACDPLRRFVPAPPKGGAKERSKHVFQFSELKNTTIFHYPFSIFNSKQRAPPAAGRPPAGPTRRRRRR